MRQLVVQVLEPRRLDLRAARALIARLAREAADQRHAAGILGQRQQRAVVLEQDDARRGRAPGDAVMRVEVRRRRRLRRPCHRALHEHEQLPDELIQARLVEPSLAHGLDDGRRSRRPRHLQMQAGGDRRDAVVDRQPVRHDDAAEAPLLDEDLAQQPPALHAVLAVQAVVGRHDRPRVGLVDGDLERAQVDLAQRALVHDRVGVHAPRLVLVGDQMLQAGTDAASLHAANERGRHPAAEHRVLGEVLEVAPAERRALEVDPRSQQHADALGAALRRDRTRNLLDELQIPRGRERGLRREARRGQGVREAEVLGGAELAQARGPVGEPHGRDAEPLDRHGRPGVAADGQRRLLLERQLGEQLVRARLHVNQRTWSTVLKRSSL